MGEVRGCAEDEVAAPRLTLYVSPTGTVEILSPESLEADRELTDALSEILSTKDE